MRFSICF